MKVNILYNFDEHQTGGGTHFLKILKDKLKQQGVYSNSIEAAEVIIINSHHNVNDALNLKRSFPEKVFIHRVDGPMSLYNQVDDQRDKLVEIINRYVCDGTLFQSEWSRIQNSQLKRLGDTDSAVMLNTVDQDFFEPKDLKKSSKKIRLIAVSWSSNHKKGFDVYQWMDRHLDFDKYEMTFIGNTPFPFENIQVKSSLTRKQIVKALQESDVYVTASQKDPCSNALLEGLACGLPALVLKDGGHPEILGEGGECFRKAEEIPNLLEKIMRNYSDYQSKICLQSLDNVAQGYYKYCEQVYNNLQENKAQRKHLKNNDYYWAWFLLNLRKLNARVKHIFQQF